MRDYDSWCVGGIGISAGPSRGTMTGESAIPESPRPGPWFREPRVIRAGVIAGGLTLVLRLVGVMVGPLALVVAIAAIVFLPGPDYWADRFLVAAAALLGWLPVLGWVPKLGSSVDVEGLLLATAVGVAVAHQVGRRHAPSTTRRRIVPAEALALAMGAGVAIWWGIPFLRQSVAGRLRLLLPGWDNPTHLNFLSLNIKLGSFVTVQPNAPSGLKYDAWEYPQGWHQTWAEFVRLWYRHPPSDARSLVNIYTVALVVTAAIAVTIGCVAIARLCRDPRGRRPGADEHRRPAVRRRRALDDGVVRVPELRAPGDRGRHCAVDPLAVDHATTGDLLRRERARARVRVQLVAAGAASRCRPC